MRDEGQDMFGAYCALLGRMGRLEEICNRLAAASVDPVAVADFEQWKTGG